MLLYIWYRQSILISLTFIFVFSADRIQYTWGTRANAEFEKMEILEFVADVSYLVLCHLFGGIE